MITKKNIKSSTTLDSRIDIGPTFIFVGTPALLEALCLLIFEIRIQALWIFLRGHSITTWREFCHFLPPPVRTVFIA